MRLVMEIPPNECLNVEALMLGGEPDQAMDNRTTDFNPDWIRLILLLTSDLCQIDRNLGSGLL